SGWIAGINSGALNGGYQQSTTQLLQYAPDHLSGMNSDELAREEAQYTSVQLSDGATTTATATIRSIRANPANVHAQMDNLEQDSLSSHPNLNTEVSVLNKINASGVFTLRTLKDSNKLLASLLEQQVDLAKQQREVTTNVINADIERRASLAGNLS